MRYTHTENIVLGKTFMNEKWYFDEQKHTNTNDIYPVAKWLY